MTNQQIFFCKICILGSLYPYNASCQWPPPFTLSCTALIESGIPVAEIVIFVTFQYFNLELCPSRHKCKWCKVTCRSSVETLYVFTFLLNSGNKKLKRCISTTYKVMTWRCYYCEYRSCSKFVLVAMKVEAPHPLWCPKEKGLLIINIRRGWGAGVHLWCCWRIHPHLRVSDYLFSTSQWIFPILSYAVRLLLCLGKDNFLWKASK